ncbi:MAG: silent information regulator protein Sir2 [Armatimonadota bacterium]|nr:silent information regulator protein Sir2 [Armatimonadota bacterium]
MQRHFLLAAVVALGASVAKAPSSEAPKPLVFEAEDYVVNRDAWNVNQYSEEKWNLWSTDRDAEKKWSGGVVLQSPVVRADRATPEEGAPPLHVRITGIPPGTYRVSVTGVGRPIALSLDGKTWVRRESGDGRLGTFEIRNGVFEFWADDRYATSPPGSTYLDTVVLAPRLHKPSIPAPPGGRVRERLSRGVVAMPIPGGGVYIGWRLLQGDPKNVAFNVYRRTGSAAPVRLNAAPLTRTTDFVDTKPPAGTNRYFVKPLIGGKETGFSEEVAATPSLEGQTYLSIKLAGDHTFQKVGIADLDGDGRLDFVIKQPDQNVDPYVNYWKRSPGTYTLEAYRHDGQLLWRHDLGWAIEQGIWYSPYVVFDLDGDGSAEVAVKTGEGDPRDPDGRVQSGPEYLSILDGRTGKEKARVDWPSREGFPDYNYFSRNQLGVAFLDGKTPALIVERGTYNTIKVVAYTFRGGRLRELWRWNDREDGAGFRGQGAHCLRAADVDGDGRDEVILGSAVLDDNGTGLWTTGLGHPDHMTVGDLDPTRPGLEIQYGIEPRRSNNGICMVDARTGDILWGLDEPTQHIHASGLCADIDPAHPGAESYAGERDFREKRWLFSAQGKLIAAGKDLGGLSPRAAYWDADLFRELVTGGRVRDYEGAEMPPRLEGSVVAVVDLLGDWREEIITSRPGEMRIYTTTIPATDRRRCLLQDPIYRLDVAGGSQGYYQIPGITTLPSAEEER